MNLGSFADENDDESGGLGDCDDDVGGDGGEVHVIVSGLILTTILMTTVPKS